jgi:hypothetical protein
MHNNLTIPLDSSANEVNLLTLHKLEDLILIGVSIIIAERWTSRI